MNITIHNLGELSEWTAQFLEGLHPKDIATIVSLSGDLGTGKTAFVKKAAEFFGIKEPVTSPTFVIQKEYAISHASLPFRKMVHIDAYRLNEARDLESLGWDNLIQDPKTIIFLEWPEMVTGIAMPAACRISFSIENGETRSISVQ